MAITPNEFGEIVKAEIGKYAEISYKERLLDKLEPGLQSRLNMRRKDASREHISLSDGFTVIAGNAFLCDHAGEPYSEKDNIVVAVEFPLATESYSLDQRKALSRARPYGILAYDVSSLKYTSATVRFRLETESVYSAIRTVSGAKTLPPLEDMVGIKLQEGVEYFFKTIQDSRAKNKEK